MANVFTPAFAQMTADKLQETLYTKNIARQLCNTALKSKLSKGASVDRPRRTSTPTVDDYTRGTDVTSQDITLASDVLTIDQEKNTRASYLDKFDDIQDVVNIAEDIAEAHGEALAEEMDKEIFSTMATDAATTFGITSGEWADGSSTAADLDGDLFISMVSKLKATLGKNNAKSGEIFLAVDHEMYQVAEEKLINLGFNTADAVIGDGFKGTFRGVKVYASNNLSVTTGVVSVVGGVAGSTDLVIQSDITMNNTKAELKNGYNMWADMLYGVDTPENLKVQLVEFLVNEV